MRNSWELIVGYATVFLFGAVVAGDSSGAGIVMAIDAIVSKPVARQHKLIRGHADAVSVLANGRVKHNKNIDKGGSTGIEVVSESKQQNHDGKSYHVERFVTYLDCSLDLVHQNNGFGNRLQSLQIALLFALATRRTLVVQPFTLGHNTDDKAPYTELLEPITGLPTRLSDQMENTWSDGALNIDLNPKDVNKDFMQLASRYANSSASVLCYSHYWGYWQSMFRDEDHAAIRAKLSTHIRFRRGLTDGAALVQTWLGKPYGAVHFRLGDRQGNALLACEELNCTDKDRRSCCTTELGLTPNSAAAGGLSTHGLAKVYIATNDPHSSRVKGVLQSLRARSTPAVLWEGIPENIRTQAIDLGKAPNKGITSLMQQTQKASVEGQLREAVVVSIIEQLVCIEAESFLPSWPSSWDQYVVDERLKIGKADAARQYKLMLSSIREKHIW